MSEVAAILKVFKKQQNEEFTLGHLFNAVNPEWKGEVDVLQKFNSNVEDLNAACLIVVTPGTNVDRVVRITEPGREAANRF